MEGATARDLLLVVIAALLLPSSPVRASGGVSAASSDDTEFIRRRCSATRYPTLCFNSLQGYAAAVSQDPIRLAVVATNVSLASVRSVSSHVTSLLRSAAAGQKLDSRTVSALRDCEETLGSAVDLTKQSLAELGSVPTATGTEVAWLVSNVQTWMSASITDEGTCADGFADVKSSSPVGKDVSQRVGLAEEYTSNALALVNSLQLGTRS